MNMEHKWLITQIIDGIFESDGITAEKHKEMLKQLNIVYTSEKEDERFKKIFDK